MLRSRVIKFALAATVGLLLVSMLTAIAASNTVPVTLLSDISRPITVNDLKPPGCASLNLSIIIVGSGNIRNNGSAQALILGSASDDNIRGGSKDDCILGGGGHNTIDGGNGTNVCYGNSGDSFTNCQTIIYYP